MMQLAVVISVCSLATAQHCILQWWELIELTQQTPHCVVKLRQQNACLSFLPTKVLCAVVSFWFLIFLPFFFPAMWSALPAVLDAACCYRCSVVFVSVCVLVTLVSPAKTDEPVEISACLTLKEPYIGATWWIRYNDLCGGGDSGCRYHYCSNLFCFHGWLFYIAELRLTLWTSDPSDNDPSDQWTVTMWNVLLILLSSADHMHMRLSIAVAGQPLVFTNFTFYDCSFHTS